MSEQVALIGFGEAAMAFAGGMDPRFGLRAYDVKTDAPASRRAKLDDYRHCDVRGTDTAAEAIAGAGLILSLVTADQALAAAEAACASLHPGALYCDMNSVAPATKQRVAAAVEAAGVSCVDVAVMSPVRPARLAAPLLLSGGKAAEARKALADLGFSDLSVVGDRVGEASAIKMIRSVMVKGIEALSAECFLAAEAAGVTDAVLASLDESWPAAAWLKRVDYNLERMLVHGLRRAAEMDEAVKTLDALGTGSAMTRATAERQRAIGSLGLVRPPADLAAKARLILDRQHAA